MAYTFERRLQLCVLAILLETQEMTIKLMDSLPDMVEEEED